MFGLRLLHAQAAKAVASISGEHISEDAVFQKMMLPYELFHGNGHNLMNRVLSINIKGCKETEEHDSSLPGFSGRLTVPRQRTVAPRRGPSREQAGSSGTKKKQLKRVGHT